RSAREALRDEFTGQIAPQVTAVEHGTIGRRNDSLRISEIVIRIGSQLDRPGPSSLSCQIEDDASQATAVGDRFVQPPVTRTTADRGKCFANQSKCGHGLLNATIASV